MYIRDGEMGISRQMMMMLKVFEKGANGRVAFLHVVQNRLISSERSMSPFSLQRVEQLLIVTWTPHHIHFEHVQSY
ncbi:hypothetical protein HBI56_189100 [Parastagonospora nodorum]|uniref:Uncharacterized protein n=1 Tax=Phaeosphaeria nodorum (strain SN15 / ATCC MYA-4574 / FGSC 10173) TaxID=321614 RepID=A0A7U2FA30_PHANO|nr:hypothetical protein HBH56_145380 [Parastagonospora nodorum]QRD01332.1 hypothetical protein JI435_416430 [Parastagonospora nodorum SN15]KAH3927590.1 hypothetical protein HBH54_150570 [Parastagonospora nodorum]KAH3947952.1 hypothetical protein HBH53_110590 [Parastagonospora nodorum]KAH3960161.1 hypothetical protein HBH51_194430 [Parastagonospora nodorum]